MAAKAETKDPREEDIAVVVGDSGEGEDEDATEGQRRLAEILSTYAAFRTLPNNKQTKDRATKDPAKTEGSVKEDYFVWGMASSLALCGEKDNRCSKGRAGKR